MQMKKSFLVPCLMLLLISLAHGQETKEKKGEKSKSTELQFELKDAAKPDVYVDGKKFDFPMELIDKSKIESVNVIKGDKAIKEYNAKNGVVLITTKKNLVEIDESKVHLNDTGDPEKTPKIIIDGKVSDRSAIEKLSPDDIESIEVVKDEQAIKKYDAPNGAVIVKTKKDKKN